MASASSSVSNSVSLYRTTNRSPQHPSTSRYAPMIRNKIVMIGQSHGNTPPKAIKDAFVVEKLGVFNEFIKSLIKELKSLDKKKYSNQIKELRSLSPLSLKNAPNVLVLKQGTLDIENKIIGVLSTLDDQVLDKLESTPSLENAKELINIPRLYKQADAAENVKDERWRQLQLKWVATLLAEAEQFSRAHELAKKMQPGILKDEVLKTICKNLVKVGKFDTALEVAKEIGYGASEEWTYGIRGMIQVGAYQIIANALCKEANMSTSDAGHIRSNHVGSNMVDMNKAVIFACMNRLSKKT